MFFFLFLCDIFLPALNRKNCDKENVGFSCNDLNKGINYLEKNLLNRDRFKKIAIKTKIKSDSDSVYNRLVTVAYALATDSIPVFEKDSDNIPTYPEIATFLDFSTNAQNVTENLSDNQFITDFTNETNIYAINSTASAILFSPILNEMYDKIGPAALHIIIHFALNLSDSLTTITHQHQYSVFQGTRFPPNCGNYAGTLIPNRCNYNTLIETSRNAANFIQPLANLHGWLINLIRGEAPVLYDKVGKACWKARSYLAGGVNPIYPGTGRSLLDISRSNPEHFNTTIINKYLKLLI